MKLRAIHNHIVFQFVDNVTFNGRFEEGQSAGGIVLLESHDSSAKAPRWGKVVSLGPKCSEQLRTPGCEILIDALRWSIGVDYNGQKLWRTDEDQLLGYRYPGD